MLFLVTGVLPACESLQYGVEMPTFEHESITTPTVKDADPEEIKQVFEQGQGEATLAAENTEQDFSRLRVEYWDPKYGYCLAIPAHWRISPNPTQG